MSTNVVFTVFDKSYDAELFLPSATKDFRLEPSPIVDNLATYAFNNNKCFMVHLQCNLQSTNKPIGLAAQDSIL